MCRTNSIRPAGRLAVNITGTVLNDADNDVVRHIQVVQVAPNKYCATVNGLQRRNLQG